MKMFDVPFPKGLGAGMIFEILIYFMFIFVFIFIVFFILFYLILFLILDLSGVVVKVGQNVNNVKVGDEGLYLIIYVHFFLIYFISFCFMFFFLFMFISFVFFILFSYGKSCLPRKIWIGCRI